MAEAAGASGEELGFGVAGDAAESGHRIEAADWIQCTDEDSPCLGGEVGGDVETVVHTVDEVNVCTAGRAEEDSVVGGEAASGVGGGIGEAEVGLDLDDAADETLVV